MAFKEVTGGSNIKAYWPKKAAERKVGDAVTGVYEEKMSRRDPNGIEQTLYLLKTSEGLTAVNSSATIARAMEQIPRGSTVKIVYEGKARSNKTGREYNNFKVYVDEDNGNVSATSTSEDVDLSNLDF